MTYSNNLTEELSFEYYNATSNQYYKLSNNTKKMLTHGINQCKKLLKEAGAENVIAFGPVRNTGWHLVGTAKMGKSKKNSVVNKFGQCHDINNLFIESLNQLFQ